MILLLKTNAGDRRPNVVILECFFCWGEGSEVGMWEGSEVARWERCKSGEVARWERRESGEVRRWEVPGFFQGWQMQVESKISSFCFRCQSREQRSGIGSRFSCVAAGMEKLSLDLP